MQSVPPQDSEPRVQLQSQIRDEWEAAAPEWGRRDLWPYVEDAAQSINDRLVDLAGLGPGDRVLDVGTGIGEPAATAARRVGGEGRVLGIDLAPRMIEEGRKRMHRLGLDHVVELRCADGEHPDLGDETFHAVLSRWTLMLAADFPGTLAGYLQFLEPRGRLAVALWGHPDRVPFISVAMNSAMELLDVPPPSEPAPRHFWHQGCDALGRSAREAGFEDVHTETVNVTFTFPSTDVYGDFISRMAGPIKVLTDRLPTTERERLTHLISRRAEPFRQEDGSVRIPAENLILYGTRPSA